jgi:signal transduction histidine kinase
VNHEPRFHAKGVALRFTERGGAARVSADADRLSQAVINVLVNALDFTPRGGVVDVSVSAAAGDAEIRVSDTGAGINPEDLPRIFERLYRADPSRSRSTGGSGIGLSIARAIVQAHGGAITAESVPGKGSVFTISLPVLPAA